MDMTQFVRTAGSVGMDTAVSGTVSAVRPAPATAADDLYVTLPDFDDDYDFGPCNWSPVDGVFPSQGAAVQVVFDSGDGAPTVVWWAGAVDTGWVALPASWITAPWTAASGSQYRLQGNIMRFSGSVTTGTTGTQALSIPAGFRPYSPSAATRYFLTVMGSAGAVCSVAVTSAGALTPTFSAGTTVALGPLSWTVS